MAENLDGSRKSGLGRKRKTGKPKQRELEYLDHAVGKPCASTLVDRLDERVDLLKRRVHIRRHSKSFELRMLDGCGHDATLLEQVGG